LGPSRSLSILQPFEPTPLLLCHQPAPACVWQLCRGGAGAIEHAGAPCSRHPSLITPPPHRAPCATHLACCGDGGARKLAACHAPAAQLHANPSKRARAAPPPKHTCPRAHTSAAAGQKQGASRGRRASTSTPDGAGWGAAAAGGAILEGPRPGLAAPQGGLGVVAWWRRAARNQAVGTRPCGRHRHAPDGCGLHAM
jgi:hypothetical protein